MKKILVISALAILLPALGGADSDAQKVFEQMKQAIGAIENYESDYIRYSSAAGENPIHTKKHSAGKYIRSPKRHYEKVFTVDANFPDPLQPGTQMIYDGNTDISTLLLPGARRILGELDVFAESPQLMMFNGETTKDDGLWDWINRWENGIAKGKLSVETKSDEEKKFSILTITFPAEGMSQRPRINKWEIWVSQDDNLPWKYYGYIPGKNEPVFFTEYSKLELNPGLEPDDIEFEGMSFWKFPAEFVADAEGLENIKPDKLEKAKDAAPGFPVIRKNFQKSMEGVQDYHAVMKTKQRYMRIRGGGTLDFHYRKDPLFFYIYFRDDTQLNVIHPATPGSKLCYVRDRHFFHVVGGGLMRLVGVQELGAADTRYDFACGENFMSMNLFELAKRMEWYEKNGTVSVEMVKFNEKAAPRVLMTRKGKPFRGEIRNMAVIFDPETWMPLRVEYLGSLDPEGFTYFDYMEIKTNTGFNETDYYFD